MLAKNALLIKSKWVYAFACKFIQTRAGSLSLFLDGRWSLCGSGGRFGWLCLRAGLLTPACLPNAAGSNLSSPDVGKIFVPGQTNNLRSFLVNAQ